MEHIDLDMTNSVSEINYNIDNILETSVGTEGTDATVGKQSGGFFWSSTGCSMNSDKALLACKQRNFEVVTFMIKNDMVDNYKAQDQDGSTILHYLIRYRNTHKHNDFNIEKILRCDNVKTCINIQDNLGNTALHLAVQYGHMDIADRLVNSGADKSIKNNDGLHVDSETCVSANDDRMYLPNNSDSHMSESRIVRNIVDTFMQPKIENSTATIGLPSDFRLSEENSVPTNIRNSVTEEDNVNTEQFLNNLIKNFSVHRGGGYKTVINNSYTDNLTLDTDGLLEEMSANITDSSNVYMMNGGGKKTVGDRKIVQYAGNSSLGENKKNYSQLSRMIDNQASDVHNRALKKISEMAGVDEITAKNLRGALYDKVRKDKPELKSFLDRAVEMEQLITKEVLESKHIKQKAEEIRKKYLNKKKKSAKTPSTDLPRESSIDTVSATSPVPVSYYNTDSATSVNL